jgi:hypothetical protein
MGFWVSLYFNHEQGIKRSHMPIVGLNNFWWNVRYMHVNSSPHLLGELIKYYYYIIGKNVIKKLM